VAGGIFIEIDFDLHDPNEDGKLRWRSWRRTSQPGDLREELAFLAPLAVFDVTGEIFAKLFAFLKIDLGFSRSTRSSTSPADHADRVRVPVHARADTGDRAAGRRVAAEHGQQRVCV
jgi:hypothetical protein